MQLHSMIELQLLEALDSEQARIMLPYRDILAFKSLLGFCKIPAHVGWQLLKQRVEKLSVADRVILVRELPDAFFQREAKRPSDAVGWRLDLDDACSWVGIGEEECFREVGSDQALVDQVYPRVDVRQDADSDTARTKIESQETIWLLADRAQVLLSSIFFVNEGCMG